MAHPPSPMIEASVNEISIAFYAVITILEAAEILGGRYIVEGVFPSPPVVVFVGRIYVPSWKMLRILLLEVRI